MIGFLAERSIFEPVADLESQTDAPPPQGIDVTSTDGTRLRVLASGPADAPRVLLIHGLSLTQEIWTSQRAALESTFRVVSLDLRGHGESDDAITGDYSAMALGQDICAVLEKLAGQRCVVVGHSMGGMALVAGLTERPDLLEERVAGVALVNTAASAVISGLGGGSVAASIAFARERVRSSLVGLVVYGGLDSDGLPRGNDLTTLVTRLLGVGSATSEAAVQQLRRLILNSRPHVAGEMWRTAGTLDQLTAARGITVPSLIIAGQRDRVLPAHHSRRLSRTLPDAELVILEGVGHVAMLERPDEVSEILDRFARRVLGLPGTVRSAE